MWQNWIMAGLGAMLAAGPLGLAVGTFDPNAGLITVGACVGVALILMLVGLYVGRLWGRSVTIRIADETPDEEAGTL